MLAALETGVKGGKWYSLMDKVWHPATLAAAWLFHPLVLGWLTGSTRLLEWDVPELKPLLRKPRFPDPTTTDFLPW